MRLGQIFVLQEWGQEKGDKKGRKGKGCEESTLQIQIYLQIDGENLPRSEDGRIVPYLDGTIELN